MAKAITSRTGVSLTPVELRQIIVWAGGEPLEAMPPGEAQQEQEAFPEMDLAGDYDMDYYLDDYYLGDYYDSPDQAAYIGPVAPAAEPATEEVETEQQVVEPEDFDDQDGEMATL